MTKCVCIHVFISRICSHALRVSTLYKATITGPNWELLVLLVLFSHVFQFWHCWSSRQKSWHCRYTGVQYCRGTVLAFRLVVIHPVGGTLSFFIHTCSDTATEETQRQDQNQPVLVFLHLNTSNGECADTSVMFISTVPDASLSSAWKAPEKNHKYHRRCRF